MQLLADKTCYTKLNCNGSGFMVIRIHILFAAFD